jgi:hypothetical protein
VQVIHGDGRFIGVIGAIVDNGDNSDSLATQVIHHAPNGVNDSNGENG